MSCLNCNKVPRIIQRIKFNKYYKKMFKYASSDEAINNNFNGYVKVV